MMEWIDVLVSSIGGLLFYPHLQGDTKCLNNLKKQDQREVVSLGNPIIWFKFQNGLASSRTGFVAEARGHQSAPGGQQVNIRLSSARKLWANICKAYS